MCACVCVCLGVFVFFSVQSFLCVKIKCLTVSTDAAGLVCVCVCWVPCEATSLPSGHLSVSLSIDLFDCLHLSAATAMISYSVFFLLL